MLCILHVQNLPWLSCAAMLTQLSCCKAICCSAQDGPLCKLASLSALLPPFTMCGALIADPDHDTMRLAPAARRAGRQLRSSTRREHHHHQQQHHHQARTAQALAGRQASVAANHFNAVMPPTSTSEGKIRHAAADCHMRSTRINGYMVCEVRRPRRA